MSITSKTAGRKKEMEYPRPTLRRKDNYMIINDGWTLNGRPIKLPFPPEAQLSGYAEDEAHESGADDRPDELQTDPTLVYRYRLAVPEEAGSAVRRGGHFLLHFGAVDQVAEVYADGEFIVRHEGGYTPFSADITDCVREMMQKNDGSEVNDDGSKQDDSDAASDIYIEVRVTDNLDHRYPYGKQRKDRGGMWYTPVSGIWQSVWCEWVPHDYIRGIRFTPGETSVSITVDATNASLLEYGSITIGEKVFPLNGTMEICYTDLGDATHYWSPEDPYLYDVRIDYGDDSVSSYLALRTVAIKDICGCKRICINGRPVFLNGVLDQGYHMKGIFVPESPDEYGKDILRMKELGFNMLRKHIKVEPELFYYACDRLGMFVLQDFVNNGDYNYRVDTVLATIGIGINDRKRYRDLTTRANFVTCAEETQDFLHNHPSVIGYTVFNEGWGQTDSDLTGDYLRSRDQSRFYDYTSGWFEQKHSQVESRHVYFRNKKLKSHGKPVLLSEFGGFIRVIDGHVYDPDRSYGYGKCDDEASLTDRIMDTYRKMIIPAIPKGLCGCVYTQLSDIEEELNGLYTYDREICKVDKSRLTEFMNTVVGML